MAGLTGAFRGASGSLSLSGGACGGSGSAGTGRRHKVPGTGRGLNVGCQLLLTAGDTWEVSQVKCTGLPGLKALASPGRAQL